MQEIIGIDPGVRKTYYVILQDGIPSSCGIIQSHKLSEIYAFCKDRESLGVLETPDRVDRKSTLDDILNLRQVVGRFEMALYPNNKVYIVKPCQWKGQMPKSVTENRMRKKYPLIDSLVINIPKSLRHNIFDALGLADYGRRIL